MAVTKKYLISKAKQSLKRMSRQMYSFSEPDNKGMFYLWGKPVSHSLISLEYIDRGGVDYIRLESYNETMDPKDDPDLDDLSDFDTDEIERILSLAEII